MKGSVDSIETMGLVDGPGIRTVVFLNSCYLRCRFCHNPEMWNMKKNNVTSDLIVRKVLRNKPYFKRNHGGVTFSGGEPLLQYDFLLDTCKKLKKEGIHITLDTAGVGNGNYKELLKYIDIVLLDIKHINNEGYELVTTRKTLDSFNEFVSDLNESGCEVWIRQVVVPRIHDNYEYMDNLAKYINKNIKNVTRVDFLPFHKLGREKYVKLNIPYPYDDRDEMDKDKCNELYKYFLEKYNKIKSDG